MNIKKKCRQIDSLLGDLSSTGIKPIPDIVYNMRQELGKVEAAYTAKNAGDFCGNCRQPWPCNCAEPHQCCGICAGSLAHECRCTER